MLRVSVRSTTALPAFVLSVALLVLPGPGARADEPPLPAYNADIAQTSTSGISSGAFMAVQFGTAWSSFVVGVGAIAGGPFGCSEGSGSAALSTCMSGEPAPDLADLIKHTDAWSRSGAIDDTANIAKQKIYLFSGYNDNVVARNVGNALQTFYAHYLRPARLGNLFYQTAIGAGHAQVTVAYGGGCADNGGEFINKCGYDQAGVILQHIYGALSPRNDGTLSGHVITFRQCDFTGPAEASRRQPGRQRVRLRSCFLRSAGTLPRACRLARLPAILRQHRRGLRSSTPATMNGPTPITSSSLYPQIQAVASDRQLGITNPASLLGLVGLSGRQPDPIAQLSAEVRQADRRDQGDDRPHHQRRQAVCRACCFHRLRRLSTVLAADASDSAIDLYGRSFRAPPATTCSARLSTDEAFSQIGTVVGPSYGDAGLKPATTYRYKVRAIGPAARRAISRRVVTRQTRRKVPPCDGAGNLRRSLNAAWFRTRRSRLPMIARLLERERHRREQQHALVPARERTLDRRVVRREMRRKRISVGGRDLEHRYRRVQDAHSARVASLP